MLSLELDRWLPVAAEEPVDAERLFLIIADRLVARAQARVGGHRHGTSQVALANSDRNSQVLLS